MRHALQDFELFEDEDQTLEDASWPTFEKTQKTKMRRDDGANTVSGARQKTRRISRVDKE